MANVNRIPPGAYRPIVAYDEAEDIFPKGSDFYDNYTRITNIANVGQSREDAEREAKQLHGEHVSVFQTARFWIVYTD